MHLGVLPTTTGRSKGRTVCGAATQVKEREQGVEERNGTLSTEDSRLSGGLLTGGSVDFSGATNPLIRKALETEKTIVMVRHGLSTWNFEGRVQGSSDKSILSETGIWQAERCKEALSKLKFEQCFASPISRAKTSAEVIWSDREEPLIFLDSLREANLNILEGMKNSEAKELYPELFTSWRQDPMHFEVNGVYPVRELWDHAQNAWEDILTQATGDLVLVVAHKSVLRAMLCTALGMGPDRFRAIDINNGGICVFSINTSGQPMLKSLNLTSHLQTEGVYYQL
ncbi:Phosphoglycerate mutase [Klebsormidium nitens]|uniref:Phosphoglycerate mutase n=1 Tax=Klebsormidium nitens TaxID=105231 RepID=A0A1Y1HX49_KLENI|nr:Phosphoglycerate mutase [Klebsormidium nitens]|eukprot:GAQ82723.1 Phosphoglycerate mutase [Klebsormidium nitens]